MFLGGRGGGAATWTAETSAAETLKQQKLNAEARRLTSCRETAAQLRLGAEPRISPNVRANDCDRQRNNKGHICQPHPAPRPPGVLSEGYGPSYLAYLVSDGRPKKEGTFCDASLRNRDSRLNRSCCRVPALTSGAATNPGASGRGLAVGVERLGRAISSPTRKKRKPPVILDLTLKRSLSTTGSETLTRKVPFHLPLEDRIQTKCVQDTDVELGKLRRTNKKKSL